MPAAALQSPTRLLPDVSTALPTNATSKAPAYLLLPVPPTQRDSRQHSPITPDLGRLPDCGSAWRSHLADFGDRPGAKAPAPTCCAACQYLPLPRELVDCLLPLACACACTSSSSSWGCAAAAVTTVASKPEYGVRASCYIHKREQAGVELPCAPGLGTRAQFWRASRSPMECLFPNFLESIAESIICLATQSAVFFFVCYRFSLP